MTDARTAVAEPRQGTMTERRPVDAPPGGRLLRRSEIRGLVGLATNVEFAEAAVTALYEATRGNSGRARALLRPLSTGRRAPAAAVAHVFRRDSEYWKIVHTGRVLHLRDTKGLRYLACLLHQPGQSVSVTALTGAPGTANGAGRERARLAVTKAVKAALARIAAAHPELGRHLAATVRRGYVCVYRPAPRTTHCSTSVPAPAPYQFPPSRVEPRAR